MKVIIFHLEWCFHGQTKYYVKSITLVAYLFCYILNFADKRQSTHVNVPNLKLSNYALYLIHVVLL